MADVSLSGVTKDFGEVRILHGIDLQIRDGEFMVFVGPRAAASPRCCA
jgi:multiple sugar transport system ATP-binding protein